LASCLEGWNLLLPVCPAGIKVRDKRLQPNLRGRAAFTNGPRKHPNFFVDIGVLPLGIRIKIIP